MATVNTALSDVNGALVELGITGPVGEGELDPTRELLAGAIEEDELSGLADQRRRLEAIRREADRSASLALQTDESNLAQIHRDATVTLEDWQRQFEPLLARLRERVTALAPASSFPPSDVESFRSSALAMLRDERQRAVDRAVRSAQESKRLVEVTAELVVARKNLGTIDEEIGRIAENSGSLGAALAELSSFISDEICPVCDRNFAEEKKGPLAEHLNQKVRMLTGLAVRLLGLGRNRGDQQLQIERLEREAAELAARPLDPRALADLERNAADLESIVAELDQLAEVTLEGSRLAAVETAARRALADHQSRDLARTAAMATLTEFAQTIGQPPPAPFETPNSTIDRLLAVLKQRADALNLRAAARKKGREAVQRAREAVGRRDEVDAVIAADERTWRRNNEALTRAGSVRSDAQKIRAQVEAVRSRIIRREFNDRLNRLWRDLFVRLAPTEQFVPAFQIPTNSTQHLQPKLITLHRWGGDAGGTPGTMLSAGNLNTAALTLFIALHLTVAAQLRWLILDDPIQSMDDVHIAHFAALLRTLSKEHRRQVIIAVHNRQLFEYLRLELSPAFAGDSLLSLELSRDPNRDTLCLPERRNFQEETALRFAA
jgi:exonuclease SbcC